MFNSPLDKTAPVRSAARTIVALVSLGAAGLAMAAPVANLETTVLKISGQTLEAGAVIAAGTRLSPVHLVTADPDSGSQTGVNSDPYTLVAREQVSFSIDGKLVASSVPDMRAALLHTDAGDFTVLVFSAGGNSFALARLNEPIGTASTVSASSALNTGAVSSIVTYEYGLLPVNAIEFRGRVFVQSYRGNQLTGATSAAYRIYDADNVRGSGDSVGDEVGLPDLDGLPATTSLLRLNSGGEREVQAMVQFSNGSVQALRAVAYSRVGSYDASSTSFLFDSAALSALGQKVDTVTAVVATSPLPNDLGWEQLGFAR